ncbi:camphor resistance protein CrcB [Streptosporangium canum]|uniref:Fluoride-specific ion channel FluC n=1 Tax=Streptosporangium canum TaxID=324952 RepID=A0A1I3PT46_9ACTN|nr:CrcB family protein [Streptosporangium canum]SFJ24552.1 camphor resistance protein CrcB [Streptosporangium canum]
MTAAILVLLGGAVGASLRDLLGVRIPTRFPWAIFVANVAASFLLGLVVEGTVAGRLPEWLLLLACTGFCGALSTYSTLANDTLRLAEKGERRLAVANMGINVVFGLVAAFIGAALARAL